MDLNNKLNKLRIRDIIIIYLFSTFIVSGIIFGVLKVSHQEMGNFVLNTLSLILQLIILMLLLLKIKPSKNDILFLAQHQNVFLTALSCQGTFITF